MREENLRRLKAAMVLAGITAEQIATALDVDKATVYRKLSGKSEFVVSEAAILRKVLHLSDDEFNSIFFNQELTEMQEFEKRRKNDCA